MINQYSSTNSSRMATVVAVDLQGGTCKCLGDQGEYYTDVTWTVPTGGSDGIGADGHPQENNRVLVDTSTGSPIIVGTLLSPNTNPVPRMAISKQGEVAGGEADYTTGTGSQNFVCGPGTPKDQRVGDQITTGESGLFGLLRGGTFIAKSSPLAQMVLSRFGDLGRLITRNFEHFTDMDSTYKVSIRNKLYSLREVFRTPGRSRGEQPSLVRYEGDVAMAETIGKGYAAYTAENFPTDPLIPEDVNMVVKEYTYDDSDTITSTYTQEITGYTYRQIVAGESSTVQTSTSQEIRKEVRGGAQTNYWMNETDFHWDVNEGKVFINGNADGVVINVDGQVVINCSADGNLTVTNTGNTQIDTTGTLNVSAANTTFDIADTTFNTGTCTFNCGGNFVVSAPTIQLN